MKQKYLCDYYPRCIMSIGLMFDDIITNIIRNKKLARDNKEYDFIFTNTENNIIYMYRGSLQDFYWEKGTHECLEVPCVYFHFKRTVMKQYSTHILKIDTSSGDMNEKVDHWFG